MEDQAPDQPLDTLPPWEDVAEEHQKAFPDLDPVAMRKSYEGSRTLAVARGRAKTLLPEEGAAGAILRQSMPFASQGMRTAQSQDYSKALGRLKQGQAEDADYDTIAEHERLQQLDAERGQTLGGVAGSSLAHVPAIVGEFGVGAGLIGGAAGILPRGAAWLSRGAAGEASVAVPKLLSATGLAQAGTNVSALAAVVPSMYVEKWTRDNMQAGRDPLDPLGLPKAYGFGILQTAVFSGIGGVGGSIPGATGGAVLKRFAAGVGTGVGAAQIVDAAGGLFGETTVYGNWSDAARGNWGPLGRHLFGQLVTFSAFSGLHAFKDPGLGQAAGKYLDQQAAKGVARDVALGNALKPFDAIAKLMETNPDPTQEQVQQALAGLTGKDAESFADVVAHSVKWGDQPGKTDQPPELPGEFPDEPPSTPPAPQGGPPAPEPGTGLINPVQTGVPGVVSGAREIPEPVRPQEPPAATEVATEAYQKYLKAQRTLDEAKKAEAREAASGVVSGNGRRARIRASKDLNQARYEWEQAGASAAAGRQEAEGAKPTTPQEIVKPAETPEEAALRHQLTHSKKWPDVGNTALFEEGAKPGAVAVTDVDGLGKLGKGEGDAVVRGKIDALRAAGLEPYHAGQDEFYVKGSSPAELEAKLEDARARLKASHNADFSYGIGRDRSAVDEPLREMKAAKKEAKPEPTSEIPKSKPEAEADLSALEKKASLGEGVHINDVFKAAGLTAREQHVVLERMLERTHEDIGADEPMLKKDGTAVSRQRVKQIEQSALKKLGLQPDFALSELNDAARAGRVADKIAAGQTLDPKDMGVDPAELAHAKHRALTVEEKAEKEMDRLLKALEKEEKDNGGRLTEDRKRFYFSELERLHREAQGLPQAEGGAAEGGEDAGRGAVEPAPVRPEPGTGLPGGNKAPGAADAQQGAPASAPENTPPETAAGGRGEAAGNELVRQAFEKNFGSASGEKGFMRASIGGRTIEAQVEHLDDGPAVHIDFRALEGEGEPQPGLQPGTVGFAHQLLSFLKEVGGSGVRVSFTAEPRRTAAYERVLTRAGFEADPEASWLDESGSPKYPYDVWKPGEKLTTPRPVVEPTGRAKVEAEARAALEKTAREGPTLKGLLQGDTAAWDFERTFGRAWEGAKDLWRFLNDYWQEWGGGQSPKTSRADEESSVKLGRFNASYGFGQMLAPRMIERVLGPKATPEARELAGEVLTEWSLRYTRRAYEKLAAQKAADAVTARAAGDAAKADTLDAEAAAAKKVAGNVTSIIGKTGKVLKTFSDYQAALNSPRMQEVKAAWQKDMVNDPQDGMEQRFRRAQGLDDTDPINSFTQIPGFPINLKPLQEGQAPGATPSRARPGDLTNTELRKYPWARQRKGDAADYDTDLGNMIEYSIMRGERVATKAELFRTMAKNEVGEWGPRGKRDLGYEIPNVNPPKGTQEAEPGERSFYVKDKGVYDEVRKALDVDERNKFEQVRKVMTVFTRANLASLGEAVSHTFNLSKSLFMPGVNPFKLISGIYKHWSGDPAFADRVLDLARIGSMKTSSAMEGTEMHGILWGGKTDPTYYASKFLDVVQRSARVMLDDAYTSLVRQGRKVDSEIGRRDFVNQVGNYTKGSLNDVVGFLKDTGLGPFATAGSNFTVQGVRAVTGKTTGQAPTLGAEALNRGEFMLRAVVATTAAAMAWNYLREKNVKPEGLRWGEIKVGQTAEGKPLKYDLLALPGVRRGLDATGAGAFLEGVPEGKNVGQMVDRASVGVWHAALHPAEGPGVGFLHTAATGENAIGMRQAPRLKEKEKQAGSSQQWENLKAALKNVNPVVAVALGADRPDKPVDSSRWLRLLGQLAPREGTTPGQHRKRVSR